MKIFESRLPKLLTTTNLCVIRTDIRRCSLNELAQHILKTKAKIYFDGRFQDIMNKKRNNGLFPAWLKTKVENYQGLRFSHL